MQAYLKRLNDYPDFLDLHVLDSGRYPFLLESNGGMPGPGRFDILFAFPGESLTLNSRWQLEGCGAGSGSNDFLKVLDRWWRSERGMKSNEADIPFQGGWFIFLAYELAQQIEPGLGLSADPGIPIAKAVRIPAAIIRDRCTGLVYACAERKQRDLLDAIEADVARLRPRNSAGRPLALPGPTLGSAREPDPETFLAAVKSAQLHIAAGDIYQANISRRWQGTVASDVEAWMLYERLRLANPGPFSGLAMVDGTAILSSSPERLIRVSGNRVETRPIAGTRPRRDPQDPEFARRSGLISNPKERAEHVMLIDLERNDLGRVCEPGSVRVDEFMAVESYAHVHHIVSNISGNVRPGTTPGEVLRAVFPGGTITGCPKVRCMRIIRELEAQPRGVYTGTMGYLSHDGGCDFNILIRTMTLTGRHLVLNAGSGIVADSIPERELAETRAKAKGMLLAIAG